MSPKSVEEWENELTELVDELKDLADDLKMTAAIGIACHSNPAQENLFRARLSRIDATHDKFHTVLHEVKKISRKLNKPVDQYQTLQTEIRSSYYEALSLGLPPESSVSGQAQNRSGLDTSCDTNSQPRLPTINIPSFAGDISGWMTFKDTFVSLVHANESLNNVQKFHYLRSALKGSAAQVIASISISDRGYEQAWASLIIRYDSQRIQATFYLMKILNFKPLTKHTLSSLEQFSATVLEGGTALRNLNLTDPAGFILIIYSLRLLDAKTRERFELEFGSTDALPTWQQFTDFIQLQTVHLQSSALICAPSSGSPGASPGPTFSKNVKHVLMSSETHGNCSKCFVCKESHRNFDCPHFRKLNPKQRFDLIKQANRCINCFASGHVAAKCPSQYSCRSCGKRHHSLLHFSNERGSFTSSDNNPSTASSKSRIEERKQIEKISSNPRTEVTQESAALVISEGEGKSILSLSTSGKSTILLGTAVARIRDRFGDFHHLRILVDSGSQRSFISQQCAKRLALPLTRNQHSLVGLGNQIISGGKHQTLCILVPQNSRFPELRTNAIVVDRICENMPTGTVPDRVVERFCSLELADPQFQESRPIDFLLGADLFGEILKGNTLKFSNDFPSAIETVLGWILLGPIPAECTSSCSTTLIAIDDNHPSLDELTHIMSKFWEVEEVTAAPQADPLDTECEKHFVSTHSRDKDGRYIVRLPFKTEFPELGNSKFLAINRFKKLEEKFERDVLLKTEYSKIIKEYLLKNYITAAPCIGKFLLPHHGVLKESSSTALRIVFDASARAGGQSLNDALLTGPKLQRDIKDIMLGFRFPRFAMTADICQMYLQIWVAPEDRAYQHFFYRFDCTEELVEYEFNRLTFGMSCSPFLALRVLVQLVIDDGSDYPFASLALKEHTYIDDVLTGADTLKDAIRLQNELITLLKKGGFDLKKWSSNAKELIENVPVGNVETPISFSNMEDRIVKVLGMQWEPISDCLSYRVQTRHCTYTKRGILSTIARMYDPLGYLTPVILKAKSLLQRLWLLKLDWDTPVPLSIAKQWETFYNELPCLTEIKIPRRITPDNLQKTTIVGFADASTLGYAAVIYLHCEDINGHCSAHLYFSKSRLAPLKTLSIPRLELCAATLLAKSLNSLRSDIPSRDEGSVALFSDSSTVLSWLHLPPHQLKTFVANRIVKILDMTPIEAWHHVKSEDNAADVASRGLDPSHLPNHRLWWTGPEWLHKPRSKWPLSKVQVSGISEIPDVKSSVVLLLADNSDESFEEIWKNFSSFSTLLRVWAYVLRFIENSRLSAVEKTVGSLTFMELHKSKITLMKSVQRVHHISSHDPIRIKKFKSLSPFTDSLGVVRVGGRLGNAPIPFESRHPILLPHRSHVVNLLIEFYHKAYLHAGPQLLHSLLRQRYWIVAGRKLVRSRVNKCMKCHRLRVSGITPFMGNLPLSRFEQGRPFINTGVDFAGPFYIKQSNRRGAALGKAYVCLFVCFSTKAIHIEVVSDLSAEAFLASLDRFIARRGSPSRIFSDNATNFVGASRHLKDLYLWWTSQAVKDKVGQHLVSHEIVWSFIPPCSPHFGGLWEAGVKSLKFHLARVLDSQPLTYEELATVTMRVEAILNSRPLHPISSSPDDLEVLTPGHFLIGAPLVTPPDIDVTDVPRNRLNRWQFLKRCIGDFWKRWRLDYLNCLQQRVKWTTISKPTTVGTMVLIRDSHSPPQQWPVGRVVEVFPGKDGVVRVVKLKTMKGEYIRSVTNLSPLFPSEDP